MTAQQILAYANNTNNKSIIIKFLPEHYHNFVEIWGKLPGKPGYPPSAPADRWMRISPNDRYDTYGYDRFPYSTSYHTVDFTPVSHIFTRKPHV